MPLAICALIAFAACPQPVIDYEGHEVFNPTFLPYLESSRRDTWQKPDEVIAALALAPGAVVADIGAGGGYFSERFASVVGPAGRVYATDVQGAMIEALQKRVKERELSNVTVVRADFDDPGLPAACCDLVFFSSVYKEIDGRVAYMEKVAALLRPGGRVAILEFRPGVPGAGPPQAMRLSRAQVVGELAAAGFALVESHDFLSREYFLIFARQRPESALSSRPQAFVSDE
jgi:ubiquinone/menaquinone biosynthesis C-methylase UbiE